VIEQSVTPELISLANSEKIRAFFDVAPKTIINWHDRLGFPITWPNGRGPGKIGYVPVRKARQWAERQASAPEAAAQ